MQITPLDGALGAEIEGLDLKQPLDQATLQELVDAYLHHKLLVIRGQDLTMPAYEAFARHWGDFYIETYDNLAMPEHPAIMEVGNVGGVLETADYRNGAAFWHTDRAYADDCNAATMLYCIHAPASGGETHFCDLVAAYDALDEETKQRIEGVHATHRYGGGEREEWEYEVHPMVPGQEEKLPVGRQPLARKHSATGKTGLYSVAGTWHEVEGHTREEASALMRVLKLHAIKPEFVTTHRYAVGDVVLWDNTQTLHAAEPIGPAVDESTKRLLRRIVCAGLPSILRDRSEERSKAH
ncbi:MAG: TauD/TfdA family dioxygenase [Rhodospirillaceae bacterium]|jgi:taurine dioxygenase|nr:TauD/TfdA family dioxygenase [Rhodospirillaceae bacterium]MBT6202364.1 TauD/TfdA family dioxygenase [Rhodospirillaceae bacterium]MBT6511965.1 TauD/TfdA family dioxygenase [Rhodospirillaceae bacterium]MBT7614368.1 TauD/TfdA family dioxygenase [Rhodospirillaceae bacterium]MBT7648715.1 TauD/TfdA family dioxygenase [Rhodospirillaceae bacterium]